MKILKYLSLFAGIGGFEYGINQSTQKMECIGYSEIDKYAESIYKRHFPEHRAFGDVTKIKTEDLPDFDFLVGGFPCQAFSIAGLRRGFDDTRGTLFFEIARILSAKRPKYFLLENVKGLLSHDKGKTFKKILEVLSDLGYDVQWEVLNSKNFGVPQNRERIYIKGYFRDKCGREILHQGRNSSETSNELKDKNQLIKLGNIRPSGHSEGNVYAEEGICSTITRSNAPFIGERKIISVGNVSPSGHRTGRVFSEEGITPTLVAGCYKCPPKVYEPLKVVTATKKGYDEAYPNDGVRLDHPGSKTGRGRVQKGSTGALMCSGQWGTVTDDYRVRRLTPTECERLQGFPDEWTKYNVDGEEVSDTQRYKCCGNAVTTNVITHIINNWDMK